MWEARNAKLLSSQNFDAGLSVEMNKSEHRERDLSSTARKVPFLQWRRAVLCNIEFRIFNRW